MPLSKRSRLSVVLSLFALLAIISGLLIAGVAQHNQSAHAAGSSPFIRQISSGGTTTITPATPGKDGFQAPEINSAVNGMGHAQIHSKVSVNRSGALHQPSFSPSAPGQHS